MYNKFENSIEDLAHRDYDHARSRAFWHKIRSMFGRKCNDLLSAEPVLKSLLNQDSHNRGLQQIPLEKIVGSSGRFRDFDLAFLPIRQERDGRWQSIARARRQGKKLPPPLLYKVGDVYLVEDGNHRISVARTNGQEFIEADVIAINTTGLIPEPSCTRLGYKITDEDLNNAQQRCTKK